VSPYEVPTIPEFRHVEVNGAVPPLMVAAQKQSAKRWSVSRVLLECEAGARPAWGRAPGGIRVLRSAEGRGEIATAWIEPEARTPNSTEVMARACVGRVRMEPPGRDRSPRTDRHARCPGARRLYARAEVT